jgi:hypothetical protein
MSASEFVRHCADVSLQHAQVVGRNLAIWRVVTARGIFHFGHYVAQRAKTRGVELDFWTYFKVGAPLTILTIAFGLLWL